MRISRPCYDKYHRCPGWAGGGMKYAKVERCAGGYVQVDYERPLWKWRIHRCNKCGVYVLPFMVGHFAPTWHIRVWWLRVGGK